MEGTTNVEIRVFAGNSDGRLSIEQTLKEQDTLTRQKSLQQQLQMALHRVVLFMLFNQRVIK